MTRGLLPRALLEPGVEAGSMEKLSDTASYYELLGVSRSATEQEINKAYKKLEEAGEGKVTLDSIAKHLDGAALERHLLQEVKDVDDLTNPQELVQSQDSEHLHDAHFPRACIDGEEQYLKRDESNEVYKPPVFLPIALKDFIWGIYKGVVFVVSKESTADDDVEDKDQIPYVVNYHR